MDGRNCDRATCSERTADSAYTARHWHPHWVQSDLELDCITDADVYVLVAVDVDIVAVEFSGGLAANEAKAVLRLETRNEASVFLDRERCAWSRKWCLCLHYSLPVLCQFGDPPEKGSSRSRSSELQLLCPKDDSVANRQSTYLISMKLDFNAPKLLGSLGTANSADADLPVQTSDDTDESAAVGGRALSRLFRSVKLFALLFDPSQRIFAYTRLVVRAWHRGRSEGRRSSNRSQSRRSSCKATD